MKIASWQDASGCGDEFDSIADAQRAAESALDDARDEANRHHEWPDGLERIAWGLVVEHVVETEVEQRCSDCGALAGSAEASQCATFESCSEFALVEHEDLADQLAALLRARPILLNKVMRRLDAPEEGSR